MGARLGIGVGLVGAGMLALLGALVRHEPAPRGDDLIYERMALHPFGIHTFPFGFRVGLPTLVNILPTDTTTGFLLLAYLAAAGSAVFAYLLMAELGAAHRVAAILAVLLCVSPPFLLVIIRQGRNTDIASVCFMMAATYFAVREARWQLALTLLLGVAFREAVLFVVPLAYALWAERPLDPRAFGRVFAVGAPAVFAYLGMRLSIQTVGEARVPGYGGSLLSERADMIKQGARAAGQELRRLFSIYGPLWIVAPFALRDMRFARRGLVLVALGLLAMTFALDWGRMILLAAPVFYPASAFVLTQRLRWRVPTFVGLALLATGYAVYMDVSGTQTGIIDGGPPPYPVQ